MQPKTVQLISTVVNDYPAHYDSGETSGTRYRSQAVYVQPNKWRSTDKTIMTQPDMSLSLHQIVTRFSTGQPVLGREGIYTGDLVVPDVRRMDPVDRDIALANIKSHIEELTAKAKEYQKISDEKRAAELDSVSKAVAYYKGLQSKVQDDAPKSDDQSRNAA